MIRTCHYLVCCLAGITVAASAVRASFITGGNGERIEDFAGTTLDAANWQTFAYVSGSQPFSQNNGLTIDCYKSATDTNYADYTSLLETVAVGQRLSVDFTVNAVNPNTFQYGGYVYIYLTTNSAGTTHNTQWDDYWLSTQTNAYYNYTQTMYGNERRAYGAGLGVAAPTPGLTYRWQIDRDSAGTATWTVLDAQGTVLGTRTDLVLGDATYPVAPHPDPLYISLFAEGLSVTFNHVVVSPIPEPSALALVAAAPLLFCRRGRTRRCTPA